MKTVTICIGNSDDKLTQKKWSEFAVRIGNIVSKYANQIHFSGTSGSCAPWQNAAWVFELGDALSAMMGAELQAARKDYRQDSVAWTEGETIFI